MTKVVTESECREAFRKLYVDNLERLVAYALRFVPDDTFALDLVQDSFMSFWDRYRNQSGELAGKLLFVIVRNKCLNYMKHKRIAGSSDNISALSTQGEELLYNMDYYYSSSEDDYLVKELDLQIRSVIDNLPQKCRQVFLMSRFQGKKNKEVACELGISEKTVEKHIHRALQAFSKAASDSSSALFQAFVLFLLVHYQF